LPRRAELSRRLLQSHVVTAKAKLAEFVAQCQFVENARADVDAGPVRWPHAGLVPPCVAPSRASDVLGAQEWKARARYSELEAIRKAAPTVVGTFRT
jgi:hypothetical protein